MYLGYCLGLCFLLKDTRLALFPNCSGQSAVEQLMVGKLTSRAPTTGVWLAIGFSKLVRQIGYIYHYY